jgi:type I protein arginine methyltransferase
MSYLTPHTRLQRVPELTLHLESDHYVQIDYQGIQRRYPEHTLAILNAFSQPISLALGLRPLSEAAVSAHDWVALLGTTQRLFEENLLRDVDALDVIPPVARGFGNAQIHIAMLNDRHRTKQYLEAIKTVVQPGDIVVEIGTGTGVLAMAAARAGASRVYAIEATSSMGQVARSNFEQNGLGDTITLIPGWSTQVELPERADLLISEIIGNDPFAEQVMSSTADALKRFLKPNPRLIPNQVQVWGVPVTVPEEAWSRRRVTSALLADWQHWYDLDLSALATMDAPIGRPLFSVKPHQAQSWPQLASPVMLANATLISAPTPPPPTTVTTLVQTPGLLNGLLVYGEINLGDGLSLSTYPQACDQSCSWRNCIWAFPQPIPVNVGDRLRINYSWSGYSQIDMQVI